MAQTGTTSYHPIFHWSKEPLRGNNNIILELEYKIHCYGTGDATGGTFSCTVDLSNDAIDPKSKLYHYFSDIIICHVGSNSARLYTHSDRFHNTIIAGIGNRVLNLWETEINYSSALNRDNIPGIMYLGKLSNDANAGEMTIEFETNADGIAYDIVILGGALKTPLPLIGIHRPMFLV